MSKIERGVEVFFLEDLVISVRREFGIWYDKSTIVHHFPLTIPLTDRIVVLTRISIPSNDVCRARAVSHVPEQEKCMFS
jgi:hypothetical protein